MIARVYQDGKYIESVGCKDFTVELNGVLLYNEMPQKEIKAFIPQTMMVIFDDSGEPDYLKMAKELKEKQG